MSEQAFQTKVTNWCERRLAEIKNADDGIASQIYAKVLQSLVVMPSARLRITSIAWRSDRTSTEWTGLDHPRELDVVIGWKGELDGRDTVIPIIAIELKSGDVLETAELDKKSFIYGSLQERFPWVQTVFLHESLDDRAMRYDTLFRNGRGFDMVIWKWTEGGKKLLQSLIDHQILYTCWYWEGMMPPA